MEWLTRWWRELVRDVALTGSGLAITGSQVFAAHPSGLLIGAGLTLTVPSTVVKLQQVLGTGSPLPLSPPGGPPLSPQPSEVSDDS